MRGPRTRRALVGVLALGCALALPAAASARVNTVIPANEDGPNDAFLDNEALYAIVLTDTAGGRVCIIPAEQTGGSCDAPAFGDANNFISFGTAPQPIENPELTPGQWRLLGDNESTGDVVSEPFTVSPCDPASHDDCSTRIADAALQRYKDAAAGMTTGMTATCLASQLWDALPPKKTLRKNVKAAEDALEDDPVTDVISVSFSPFGGFSFFGATAGNVAFNWPAHDKAFAILQAVSCRAQRMYEDIINDPLDPNWSTPAEPVRQSLYPSGEARADSLADALDRHAAEGKAQLKSYERYLGAVEAGAQTGVHLQARGMATRGREAIEAARETAGELRAYATELAADPDLADVVVTAERRAELAAGDQRVRDSGFTEHELQQLADLGYTEAKIAQVRRALTERDLTKIPAGVSGAAILEGAADDLEDNLGGLDAFTRQAAAIAGRTNSAPTAAFTATPDTGLAPLSVAFADTSTDPDGDPIGSVSWDFGDGVSGEGATATHVYTSPGVYRVTQTVSDGYTTDTEQREITVGAAAIRLRARVTPDRGGNAVFHLGEGGFITVPVGGERTRGVEPGSYGISADTLADRDLTELSCDDGESETPSIADHDAARVTANVEPGELVTCTFSWTLRGTIFVGKATDPADLRATKQPFTFAGDAGEFALTHGETRDRVLPPGDYVVTEGADPDGADLSDVACDDGSSERPSTGSVAQRRATFRLEAGETVQCTFKSALELGSIILKQTSSPARELGFWDDLAPQFFTLANGATRTIERLPGAYSFTQVSAAGTDLDAVDCDDDGSAKPSTTSVPKRRVVANLEPGETVRCTFANSNRAPPAVPRGRVFATGHDADYHCLTSGGTTQCHFLERAVQFARAGAPDPAKPILVLDPTEQFARSALETAFGGPSRVAVTRLAPQSEAFADEPLTVSRYSAIVVASDASCGGCALNPSGTADSDALLARKAAFAAFFNAGGGIVALAGAEHGNGDADDDVYYDFLPLPLGGVAVSPPFTLTPAGAAFGLDDGAGRLDDINCCATHNSFQEPPDDSPLVVAERDSTGAPETLFGEGNIVDGGFVDDTDPPVTTATITPVANSAGWHRGNATVRLKASDGADGVGVQEISWTVGGPARRPRTVTAGDTVEVPVAAEGVTTVKFRAKDKANNQEAERTATVRIDRVAPTVSIVSPVPGTSVLAGTGLRADYACADARSGVDECQGSATDGAALATGTPGTFELRVTATDRAGNTAAATRSWTVRAPEPTPSPTPTATPTPTPTPTATPAPPKEEQAVLGLSKSRRCVSRRKFTIRLREPRGDRLLSARVLVNGRQVRVIRGKRLKAPVNLKGLPKGRFTVKVVGTTRAGRTLSETRRYRTCAPKRRK